MPANGTDNDPSVALKHTTKDASAADSKLGKNATGLDSEERTGQIEDDHFSPSSATEDDTKKNDHSATILSETEDDSTNTRFKRKTKISDVQNGRKKYIQADRTWLFTATGTDNGPSVTLKHTSKDASTGDSKLENNDTGLDSAEKTGQVEDYYFSPSSATADDTKKDDHSVTILSETKDDSTNTRFKRKTKLSDIQKERKKYKQGDCTWPFTGAYLGKVSCSSDSRKQTRKVTDAMPKNNAKRPYADHKSGGNYTRIRHLSYVTKGFKKNMMKKAPAKFTLEVVRTVPQNMKQNNEGSATDVPNEVEKPSKPQEGQASPESSENGIQISSHDLASGMPTVVQEDVNQDNSSVSRNVSVISLDVSSESQENSSMNHEAGNNEVIDVTVNPMEKVNVDTNEARNEEIPFESASPLESLIIVIDDDEEDIIEISFPENHIETWGSDQIMTENNPRIENLVGIYESDVMMSMIDKRSVIVPSAASALVNHTSHSLVTASGSKSGMEVSPHDFRCEILTVGQQDESQVDCSVSQDTSETTQDIICASRENSGSNQETDNDEVSENPAEKMELRVNPTENQETLSDSSESLTQVSSNELTTEIPTANDNDESQDDSGISHISELSQNAASASKKNLSLSLEASNDKVDEVLEIHKGIIEVKSNAAGNEGMPSDSSASGTQVLSHDSASKMSTAGHQDENKNYSCIFQDISEMSQVSSVSQENLGTNQENGNDEIYEVPENPVVEMEVESNLEGNEEMSFDGSECGIQVSSVDLSSQMQTAEQDDGIQDDSYVSHDISEMSQDFTSACQENLNTNQETGNDEVCEISVHPLEEVEVVFNPAENEEVFYDINNTHTGVNAEYVPLDYAVSFFCDTSTSRETLPANVSASVDTIMPLTSSSVVNSESATNECLPHGRIKTTRKISEDKLSKNDKESLTPSAARRTGKYKILTKKQVIVLEELFKKDMNPKFKVRNKLSKRWGVSNKYLYAWFARKRRILSKKNRENKELTDSLSSSSGSFKIFTRKQLEELREHFKKNMYPCFELKEGLSKDWGIEVKHFNNWFSQARCRAIKRAAENKELTDSLSSSSGSCKIFNRKQLEKLKEHFKKNMYPCSELKEVLSKDWGIEVKHFSKWFAQARRCAIKRAAADRKAVTKNITIPYSVIENRPTCTETENAQFGHISESMDSTGNIGISVSNKIDTRDHVYYHSFEEDRLVTCENDKENVAAEDNVAKNISTPNVVVENRSTCNMTENIQFGHVSGGMNESDKINSRDYLLYSDDDDYEHRLVICESDNENVDNVVQIIKSVSDHDSASRDSSDKKERAGKADSMCTVQNNFHKGSDSHPKITVLGVEEINKSAQQAGRILGNRSVTKTATKDVTLQHENYFIKEVFKLPNSAKDKQNSNINFITTQFGKDISKAFKILPHFLCTKCKKIFTTIQNLTDHCLENHGIGLNACVKCNKIFPTKKELIQHVTEH